MKKLIVMAPKVNSPGFLSLVNILQGAGASGLIAGFEGDAFTIRNLRDRSLRIILRAPRGIAAKILFRQIYYLFALALALKENVRILLLSQFIDYPLTAVFLAKLLRMRIIDFIGGSRYVVLKIGSVTSSKFSDKIYNLIGLACFTAMVRLAEFLVFISRSTAKDYAHYVKKEKLRVAWNFPPKDFYEKFRKLKDYRERGNIVGFVGKLTVAKGALSLLKAIPIILSRDPRIKFLIIGGVDDPRIKVLLKRIIAEYPENVRHIGYVPHRKIPLYYSEMRVLILPSITEGVPHVVLESLACSTPVIATPVGGIPEVFGRRGVFYLSTRAPDEIARLILSLLGEEELLHRASRDASSTVRETITFNKAISMWRNILES